MPAKDDPTHKLHFGEIEDRLEDIGNSRLQLMDETGMDVQVLSLTGPSLHNLGSESIDLAIQTNDHVAEIIRKHPTGSRDLQPCQCSHQKRPQKNWNVL